MMLAATAMRTGPQEFSPPGSAAVLRRKGDAHPAQFQSLEALIPLPVYMSPTTPSATARPVAASGIICAMTSVAQATASKVEASTAP